jgi:hypothetical protein
VLERYKSSRQRQAGFGLARQWALIAAIVVGASAPLTVCAQDDNALVAATESRYRARLARGQNMKQDCAEIQIAAWSGVPLLRCKYRELGAAAEVTLALPDASRLARWTVAACRDAAAADMSVCARWLESRIWSASNAQFPVSGYVIEPRSVLGGSSQDPMCFLFRDGVTVRTAEISSRPPENGSCVPQRAETDPITRAFSFARVASTTRAEFSRAPGAPAEAALAGIAFPVAVRNEFIAAWSSTRNRLISGAAIADKAAGKFR